MDDYDVLEHFGTKRHSGRYPWGSGGELIEMVDSLSAAGLTELEIANGLDISTTVLRNQKALAKAALREEQRIDVIRRKEAGMSTEAISRETGIPASSVRDLLKPSANAKFQIIQKIANVLRLAVAKFKYVDIGEGSHLFLGVSETKLKNAVALLKNEGYTVHYLREPQLGTGKKTSMIVLAAPGVDFKEVYANRANVQIPEYSTKDKGHSFSLNDGPVTNISSNRVGINYKENGGGDKDGIIELRRGVPDLSLGTKLYAQVRIAIDGTHYAKGVAVYSDNLPPGVDMVFNTNKSITEGKFNVLKPQDVDSDRPFGAVTKSREYLDANGVMQKSAINIVNDQGDWHGFSRNLSSQFLSKQAPALAKEQLALDAEHRKAEYEEIMSLTNPTVKAYLLNDFAQTVDAAAVDLKAAALPRQTTNVLIPMTTIKPTEVYAPLYQNGERLALVRYPHGGLFEIAELTVNNKYPEGKKVIGPEAPDAVGIHPSVAQRLSGADFDGDFVIAIPNQKGKVQSSPELAGLKNFDPKITYAYSDDLKKTYKEALSSGKTHKEANQIAGTNFMDSITKQREMGKVSNLITDMTIQGASPSEIARAVRHSMVVIDAEKHMLNYKQSYVDNGISALKVKYQGGSSSGASTLISRSSATAYVNQRKDAFRIDPVTGKKVFIETHETYIDRHTGKEIVRQSKSSQMYETDDAYTLVSKPGTVIEKVYADYANDMKQLANQSRVSMLQTPTAKYSPQAAKIYKNEIESLEIKLRDAQRNQPLERQAQLVAGEMYRSVLKNNPGISNADKKTERGRVLALARIRVGAKKPTIDITPREWEAIQMGGISSTKLKSILRNGDVDQIRAYATPRTSLIMTPSKTNRALKLLEAGYTTSEVASALGVSASQIANITNPKTPKSKTS